jgi:hypothetical protein
MTIRGQTGGISECDDGPWRRPPHHQMIPWAVRSNFSIPHAANNQPYFRWMTVN